MESYLPGTDQTLNGITHVESWGCRCLHLSEIFKIKRSNSSLTVIQRGESKARKDHQVPFGLGLSGERCYAHLQRGSTNIFTWHLVNAPSYFAWVSNKNPQNFCSCNWRKNLFHVSYSFTLQSSKYWFLRVIWSLKIKQKTYSIFLIKLRWSLFLHLPALPEEQGEGFESE